MTPVHVGVEARMIAREDILARTEPATASAAATATAAGRVSWSFATPTATPPPGTSSAAIVIVVPGSGMDVVQRYEYTGRELASESNEYYFRFRVYGPALGQFFARDPQPQEAASHLYGGLFAQHGGWDPLGLRDELPPPFVSPHDVQIGAPTLGFGCKFIEYQEKRQEIDGNSFIPTPGLSALYSGPNKGFSQEIKFVKVGSGTNDVDEFSVKGTRYSFERIQYGSAKEAVEIYKIEECNCKRGKFLATIRYVPVTVIQRCRVTFGHIGGPVPYENTWQGSRAGYNYYSARIPPRCHYEIVRPNFPNQGSNPTTHIYLP